MKKKSDKGDGMSLFTPELEEITRRLKDKEPELTEIVERKGEGIMKGKKPTGDLEEQSRATRLEMHRVMVEQGLTELKALGTVLRGDRNRWHALEKWKKLGLWPLPDDQAADPRHDLTDQAEQTTTTAPEKPLIKAPNGAIQSTTPTRDDPLEAELIRRIRKMIESIELPERIGRTSPGKKSDVPTTLTALRIPTSLDQELRALKGPKSRHIEKAIMLYLRVLKVDTSA
jgi:hypothetical protein